jgi:hypothetical protein
MTNLDWTTIYWTGFIIMAIITIGYNLITGFNFLHLLIDIVFMLLWPIGFIIIIVSLPMIFKRNNLP